MFYDKRSQSYWFWQRAESLEQAQQEDGWLQHTCQQKEQGSLGKN